MGMPSDRPNRKSKTESNQMSGIYGAAGFHPDRPLDPVLAGRMVGAFPGGTLPGSGPEQCIKLSDAILGACPFHHRYHGAARMDADGLPCAIALHGTIYKADQLFESSDRPLAEAVLARFLREGPRLFPQLHGEFAVAIWDGRVGELTLAVDRFRIHSLLYFCDSGRIVFASRMRPLLASGLLRDRDPLPDSIVDLAGSSFIPTPHTIFRDVLKLPPGHYLTASRAGVNATPYWNIDFLHPGPARFEPMAKLVRERMGTAVKARLADAAGRDHVGAYLSGGIDSSTVAGLLSKELGAGVKCFSIGFREGKFDEMNYARIAAAAFHAEHHEYTVTPENVLEAIPVILEHFDEPFANASAIPTYYCARIAREHGVDVVFAGDGGDELFAGNERYASRLAYEPYLRIPRWIREPWLRGFVDSLGQAVPLPVVARAKRYVERAAMTSPERLTAHAFLRAIPMGQVFELEFLRSLSPAYEPYRMLRFHYEHAPAAHELDRELYLDLKLAISDNDILKVVRMTEAAGLTPRFPFLDDGLVDAAMHVPARMKMRGRHLRTFFKETYADLLPPETLAKTKHGFGLPIPIWLRTDPRLRELLHDLVLGSRLRSRGIFRPEALADLVRLHEDDKTSFFGTVLWNVMILELWFREYA